MVLDFSPQREKYIVFDFENGYMKKETLHIRWILYVSCEIEKVKQK